MSHEKKYSHFQFIFMFNLDELPAYFRCGLGKRAEKNQGRFTNAKAYRPTDGDQRSSWPSTFWETGKGEQGGIEVRDWCLGRIISMEEFA